MAISLTDEPRETYVVRMSRDALAGLCDAINHGAVYRNGFKLTLTWEEGERRSDGDIDATIVGHLGEPITLGESR